MTKASIRIDLSQFLFQQLGAAIGGGVQPVAKCIARLGIQHFFNPGQLIAQPAQAGFEAVGIVQKNVSPN